MPNCAYCKNPATREVEHNIWGEASVLAYLCDQHFQVIREDFQDGDYIERLRYRASASHNTFIAVKKERT